MRTSRSAVFFISLWLTAAALYFFAAASTIRLASNGRDIAELWPANAILVALLLAHEKPCWKTILSAGFVANIVANLVTRGSLLGPVLYGVSNTVEILVVTVLLHRSGHHDSILQSTSSVLRFLLIAGIIGPSLSGILGASTANLFFDEPFGKSFVSWLASDALGLLVFTPFFLAMFRGEFLEFFKRKAWLRRTETLALIGLTGVVTYYVFFMASKPLLFLIFPPLMAVTFRIGRIGTKAAVMVVAVIGTLGTMYGYGPVVMLSSDPEDQAHIFQVFLAILLLTCLPVAAEVTARARLVKRLDAHDREMTKRATVDGLTGILNRAGFENTANALLPNAMAEPVSLIAIDIDYFKRINDQYGHQAGDRALQHVTDIFKMHTRPNDVIGRLGGDEFVVLLPHGDMDTAMAVCERFRQALRLAPLQVDEMLTVLISLSMGVASSLIDESYAQLHDRADLALYAAKKAGRDRVLKDQSALEIAHVISGS